MSTVENVLLNTAAVAYTLLVALLGHSVSLIALIHRHFPEISSWLLLMAALYSAYKIGRKIAAWWFSALFLAIKSVSITLMVMLALFVYLRGVSNFVYFDWPRIQLAWRFFRGVLSLSGAKSSADYFDDWVPDAARYVYHGADPSSLTDSIEALGRMLNSFANAPLDS